MANAVALKKERVRIHGFGHRHGGSARRAAACGPGRLGGPAVSRVTRQDGSGSGTGSGQRAPEPRKLGRAVSCR